jgi:hypothetical protein
MRMDQTSIVTDWKPADGIAGDSSYRNICSESLQACLLLAGKVPSQAPMPQRLASQNDALWNIGGWVARRPVGEPLLDMLIDHLKYTFGKPWADEQYTLPHEKRHVVMRWWFSWCESARKVAPAAHTQGKIFGFTPTGDMKELGTLAYDLYSLRLAAALDQTVLDRLRSRDQFQGARYELAIAASLVRCGFDIKWIHSNHAHCEFEATQKLTKETIAVEVKSRHVDGTLNQPGEMPKPEEMRFRAHRHYNDALTQCPPDKCSAIFIDLNLPPQVVSNEHPIPWWAEIKLMLDKLPEHTATDPATESWLVFTNFAAHYGGQMQAPSQRHIFLPPQYARHPIRNGNTFIALIRAMETYGRIPKAAME